MRRRVLLALFLVGLRGSGAEGGNEEMFKKLCNITGMVKGLMGQSVKDKGALKGALYGENGKATFNEDGTFAADGCGLFGSENHRSHYCSHFGGAINNNHGCFGDSLLGTLLCTCVPGQDKKDLCGLVIEKGGTGLSSWGGWHNPPRDLLKKMLDKINQSCTARNTALGTSEHLENLQNAVEGIKNETKNNSLSNHNGYYLGGTTTNRHCDGSSAKDACVTYPANGNSDEPNIPWAEKILTAITTLNKTQNQAKSKDSDQTAHHQDSDDSSETDTSYEDGDEESEQEPVEIPSPQNPSHKPRSKRKRRSTIKPNEQPAEPLKAIHHDDGSFLPQPLWLLSAVFF